MSDKEADVKNIVEILLHLDTIEDKIKGLDSKKLEDFRFEIKKLVYTFDLHI